MTGDIPRLVRLERRTADLHLTWEDGTVHEVTYDDVRHACPCAKCAPSRNDDETSAILRRQVEALPPSLPTVRTVGHYAVTFEWDDAGCSSGIYRFERLWALGRREDPDGGRPYVHGAW